MYPLKNKHATKEVKILPDKSLNKVTSEINAICWDDVFDTTSTNECYERFDKIVSNIVNENSCVSRIRLDKTKKSQPWLTSSIRNSITHSKKLYGATLCKNATDSDRIKYSNYRNTLNRVKRASQVKYYSEKCIAHRNNGKELWKLINRVINKQSDKTSTVDCLEIDNLKTFQTREIANEFGKYFSSVSNEYALKITKPKKELNHYLSKITHTNDSLFLNPTSHSEINKTIEQLRSKPSCGLDGLSNKLIKKIKNALTGPLCMLFNLSLTNGEFPKIYKKSDVVPLHKSKSKLVRANYRPILLLPVMSKILEKIVYKRVYSFLDKNNTLYVSQYGFRSKHSCEHAISELISEVLKNKANNKYTLSLFLDLSKAFDTLDHSLLLKKLEIYGIRGITLNWFKSYLETQKLWVKCIDKENDHNVYSNEYDINIGTPQGSCLGPLLFLVYTNDLYLNLDYISCILFADDTTLYFSHSNIHYLQFCIEHDLSSIIDWFNANGLTLNLNKTEGLLFSPPKRKRTVELKIEEINIPIVHNTKFLGIWLDDDLSWHKHLTVLIRKLKQQLKLLSQGKNLLDLHSKKVLYYAQFHSHLKYGIMIWGNMMPNYHRKKLEKLQNKAFEMSFNLTPKLFNYNKVEVPCIPNMIKIENCKLMYQFLANLLPKKIQDTMKMDKDNKSLERTHKYDTRNKNKLNIARTNNRDYNNSFLVHSVKDFETLSVVTQKLHPLPLFMSSCKKEVMCNHD